MKLVVVCLWLAVRRASAQEACKCVPFYQCDYRADVNSAGLIDVRVDTGGCSEVLDLCCPLDDIRPTLPSTPPSPSPEPPRCGLSHSLGLDHIRIAGGSQAEYNQFPWMAALLGPERRYLCGGSLIHPRVVLTAAHCVFNIKVEELTVRLGDWDSQAQREPFPVQDRAVAEIRPHEQFRPGSLFNDIALLFLELPVDLGESVATVCLPEPNEDIKSRSCLASGWGKDAFGSAGRHPAVLKSVQLSIEPREECLAALRETRLGRFFRLHVSFLCARGGEGQDTCTGDGGGPLVCPTGENPAAFEQAGIVSWGIDCGLDIPAAYTNVALFRSWIDLQLLRRSFIV